MYGERSMYVFASIVSWKFIWMCLRWLLIGVFKNRIEVKKRGGECKSDVQSLKAFDLVMKESMSSRKASAVMKANGFAISHTTIANRVKHAAKNNLTVNEMQSLTKPGPPPRHPEDLTTEVYKWLVIMRVKRFPVSKSLLKRQLFEVLPERCKE